MRKKIYFWVANVWTFTVLVLCLIPLRDAPKINVDNVDKYIHAFFHFIFTLFWFLFFNSHFKNQKKYNAFVVSFFLSVFFGILIEIVQECYTETRSGDVFDVLANLMGAILSISMVYLLNHYNCLKKTS